MLKILTAVLLAASSPAVAQHASGGGGHDHSAMTRQHAAPSSYDAGAPGEPGQSAFAAIQEIVELLEADPRTDWSKVNVEGLRQHLIDMNNVTLKADVTAVDAPSGVQFVVTGVGPVRDSIRRMVTAHAATMTGSGQWRFIAAETGEGATLTVFVPAADLAKVKALGFIGVMTRGMHHQQHHLMIARGEHPHG